MVPQCQAWRKNRSPWPSSHAWDGQPLPSPRAPTAVPDPDAALDTDWREAIRLVRKGIVNLYDHTAVVEPLEEYERVWHAQANCEWFKVLLSAEPELEDL